MSLNNGGCFSGDTLVSMDNDNKIHISFLKVGDMVDTWNGNTRVENIIPFKFSGFMYNVEKNATVSTYHPLIKVHISKPKECFFPKKINCQRIYYSGTVYQIILENKSHIAIGCNTSLQGRLYAGTYSNVLDQNQSDDYYEIFSNSYCYDFNNNIHDIVENDPESTITNRYH